MKLKYDTLLSNFAFNFNLRHYIKEDDKGAAARFKPLQLDFKACMFVAMAKVGRCRLTVSKPELKARLVSALEAII